MPIPFANLSLLADRYVIVITKAETVGRICGHLIYKVAATEFLPLRERPLHDVDEDKFLALLKALLGNGLMYFSYSIDLTNSFQRQALGDDSQPLWSRADDRFFWNRFVQTDLIDFRLATGRGAGNAAVDPYILPVICGMLRIVPTRIASTPLTFILLTRRSRHRGGTRYFSRGMNEEGHVSNYNETEQAIVLNDKTDAVGTYMSGSGLTGGSTKQELQVMSYVQTRGSVPVFWAEVNTLRYVPNLQVRGVEVALKAARKHFDEQIRLYGDNYLVNLVNQKGRERAVKTAYEQMVDALLSSPNDRADRALIDEDLDRQRQQMSRLHYIYFDFHEETKGLQWHRAQILVDQLQDGLINGSYFCGLEVPGDRGIRLETRSHQSSVVRTNCMDCLDRTNLVQSMLGRWILTRQLVEAGILRPGQNFSNDPAFETLFRNIWADNADVVSRSYSGTGALKTDFTRTGTRTRAGMIQDFHNSATRYFKNNFFDGPRQDGFDLFLGAYLPPNTVSRESIFSSQQPVMIQSIPYLLSSSIFMIFLSMLSTRAPDSAVWPLRFLSAICLGVTVWSVHFILGHGMLYVNWPKLNTPPFAVEGYQEAMTRASTDRIMGPYLSMTRTKSQNTRNSSMSRLGYMEEGKKRIE